MVGISIGGEADGVLSMTVGVIYGVRVGDGVIGAFDCPSRYRTVPLRARIPRRTIPPNSGTTICGCFGSEIEGDVPVASCSGCEN
jgi:hypothetical protein